MFIHLQITAVININLILFIFNSMNYLIINIKIYILGNIVLPFELPYKSINEKLQQQHL